MEIKTKIVCTIGPSVDSEIAIDALICGGMDVARLNCSHSDQTMLSSLIKKLQSARSRACKPLAICLDTRGPKIRVGAMKRPITLSSGQLLQVLKEPIEGDEEAISISPAQVLECVKEGSLVLFDDGHIISRVLSTSKEGVLVQIENQGVLHSGKGVNIPNHSLPLPTMTEKDRQDIILGCDMGVDIIAASFIRKAEDVSAIKDLLKEQGCAEILVIAKIENAEGVQNFDAIIQVADGVMIARGDLGVELPISQVPRLQKMMIRKSYLAGKISVTATQMLESMIHNPRPTRAEVSDVANAIYDGTSAVMLSGETAVGKYPQEVLQVMKSTIFEAESDFSYQQFLTQHSDLIYTDIASALTLAVVKTAYSSSAKTIFAFTESGKIAQLLSRLKPTQPILATTAKKRSYHQMAISWGVTPIFSEAKSSFREAFESLSHYALKIGKVSEGDLVVVAGFGVNGTNTLAVETILAPLSSDREELER